MRDPWDGENTCNLCDFQRRKRAAEKAGKKLELKPEPLGMRVWVDGEPVGIWYMEVPEKCAC